MDYLIFFFFISTVKKKKIPFTITIHWAASVAKVQSFQSWGWETAVHASSHITVLVFVYQCQNKLVCIGFQAKMFLKRKQQTGSKNKNTSEEKRRWVVVHFRSSSSVHVLIWTSRWAVRLCRNAPATKVDLNVFYHPQPIFPNSWDRVLPSWWMLSTCCILGWFYFRTSVASEPSFFFR